MNGFQPWAVVPVYNHHARLGAVVAALREHGLPVLLVNDGSDDATRAVIDSLATAEGVHSLHLPTNGGKGAAVLAGIVHAGAEGGTHALQVDADGQHDLADVPRLLALAAEQPGALVSGCPQYDDSVPPVRFYGRYLTHVMVWLETCSLSLRDSMCGFRVYPVAPVLALSRRVRIGRRMDFDTDIMVRLYWAGTPGVFVPTRVRYPEDGVSHFRMVRDNLRMIWLHARLVAGMLPRLPRLVLRRRKRGIARKL